jgi:hypothetical protein
MALSSSNVRLAVVHVDGCATCPFYKVRFFDSETCHSTLPPRDINLGKRQKLPLWCPLKLGPTVVGLR